MATTVFGGLILEWPIGQFSDRFDRRIVILAVVAAGAVLSLTIVVTLSLPHWFLFMCIFAYGAVSFSLYPSAIAHAADHLPEGGDMLQLSRGLLMSNGFGLALGPLVAGQVYRLVGPSGLFLFAAEALGGTTIFGLWRMRRRPSVPLEEQGSFASLHEATPVAPALDPRTEDPQLELDLRPPD